MISRWSAVALLLIVAGAIALRVPQLGVRPLHNDEGVNAVKVSELWEHGRYKYDPDEYHGPTLHYATLPFLWLSSARTANDVTDAQLRYATVAFGVALILLFLPLADGIGRAAVMWAALFTAISPAMVFYSRYFIHEMLLVFFTALLMASGWRYVKWTAARFSLSPELGEGRGDEWLGSVASYEAEAAAPHRHSPSIPLPVEGRGKSAFWAALAGAALGLMWATKETFVLTFAAMFVAFAGTILLTFGKRNALRSVRAAWNWQHIGIAAAAMILVWLIFFSSFFTNFRGLPDSVKTYLPWLKRAGGHSPHIHPWYFYLERLAWFHPRKSPVWSEGLVLGLAIIGLITSFLRGAPLPRFIAIYTLVLTGIYSVISYKTPWCLLNFYLGFLLLAGIGATALLDLCRLKLLKIFVALLLLVPAGQLAWQAWRANVTFAADRRNPYVYAQTSTDLSNLVARAEGIARVAPTGHSTVIKVIAPESDYWPLPWSLRRFNQVGWYEQIPEDPFAPIVMISAKLNARLDDRSERKWIMAGLTELRPGTFFELYVELELWKKFVETLPRDVDE